MAPRAWHSSRGGVAPDRPRLHVEVHGSGPALLLAHGFGGSARNFRPQVRALRSAHRVVMLDLRGHARSEAPDEPGAYTLPALASDCLRALETAGESRAVVGGLSLGAAAALELARTRPERVRGLVLASYPAAAGTGHGLAAIAHRFADAIESRGLEAAGSEFVWGPESGLDPRGAGLVRAGFLEHPPTALVNLLRGVVARLPTPEELARELPALPVPTLVVSGAEDAGSLATARALAGWIRGSRHEVIPGAGHLVNLQRPEDFNRVLEEFLRELPVGPSLD